MTAVNDEGLTEELARLDGQFAALKHLVAQLFLAFYDATDRSDEAVASDHEKIRQMISRGQVTGRAGPEAKIATEEFEATVREVLEEIEELRSSYRPAVRRTLAARTTETEDR